MSILTFKKEPKKMGINEVMIKQFHVDDLFGSVNVFFGFKILGSQ